MLILSNQSIEISIVLFYSLTVLTKNAYQLFVTMIYNRDKCREIYMYIIHYSDYYITFVVRQMKEAVRMS